MALDVVGVFEPQICFGISLSHHCLLKVGTWLGDSRRLTIAVQGVWSVPAKG